MSDTPILPYRFARATGLAIASARLYVADNADRARIVEAYRACPTIAEVQALTRADFDALLSEIYAVRGVDTEIETRDDFDSVLQGAEQAADLLAGDDDAPIIRLLNSLLREAVNRGASDIHLEPFEKHIIVRLRIDGLLMEVASLSAKLAPYLVSRVKVMARLDIAEKRLPQDGRLSLTLGGGAYDVRVSTLPTRYGERVVMRLLDKQNALIDLTHLGMADATQKRFRDCLGEPNGIVLVTGPTGSGKTTTLYSALSILNDRARNIMTVEDPIEYALEGVSQTPVNSKLGMSFASGLRSILRQDPDVVMVGEIRDFETAEIAVQASLTGHLVLSTVHTNSAASAVTRLVDIGVEPFLLASSLRMVVAQRLVRRLCDDCKQASKRKSAPYRAKGCDACHGTGYSGRVGIFELLRVDEEIRALVQDGASEADIEKRAFRSADTLSAQARMLVANGTTTAEEVMRVARFEGDA